jgi:hypothetical protein
LGNPDGSQQPRPAIAYIANGKRKWGRAASKPSATASSILITITVLELKVPHSTDFNALLPPVFMSYVLSFVYIGIYWNKLQYGCHPQNMNNLDEQGT